MYILAICFAALSLLFVVIFVGQEWIQEVPASRLRKVITIVLVVSTTLLIMALSIYLYRLPKKSLSEGERKHIYTRRIYKDNNKGE